MMVESLTIITAIISAVMVLVVVIVFLFLFSGKR
ncbi:MAG: hypothetical protein H6Q58_2042 [Firmicutes bacterium]|nr:hypothetical protein [Bacillota bacterium]